MARRTWHRLFRSIFGSFNLRRSQIVRFQTSKLTLERLESREVPAAAINQSLVIVEIPLRKLVEKASTTQTLDL